MKFLILFSLVLGLRSQAQMLSFPLSAYSKSQRNYEEVLTLAYKKYSPIFKKVGLKFAIESDWSSDTVNAYALPIVNKTARVRMFGGYYRKPLISNDAFLLILCHEIGHHLGGDPRYNDDSSYPEAAAEGQSDYYASHTCMPIMLADQDNAAFIKRNPVGFNIMQTCNRAWGMNTPRSLICQRTLSAALALAQNRAEGAGEKRPSITDKDRDKVGTTNVYHPDNVCRLNTHIAAAICTTENDLGLSKGQVCSFRNAFERQGMRPACWYGYPKHNN